MQATFAALIKILKGDFILPRFKATFELLGSKRHLNLLDASCISPTLSQKLTCYVGFAEHFQEHFEKGERKSLEESGFKLILPK